MGFLPPPGIGGSTGDTDNRLLRADGTTGRTAQAGAPISADDSGNLLIGAGSGALSVTINGGDFEDNLFSLKSGGNAYAQLLINAGAPYLRGNINFQAIGGGARFGNFAANNGLTIHPDTQKARVGGVIFQDFIDGATTHTDGTEDTLYTHTCPATIGYDGEKLSGFFVLSITGHAVSTDRIRLYYAGTAIFDTTAGQNFGSNAVMFIGYEIVRFSATVARAVTWVQHNSATATGVVGPQYNEITGTDLTTTQILALKAIATGTNSAAGDVTAKLGKVLWEPAAP